MTRVYLGLGSNLGDKRHNLEAAVGSLKCILSGVEVSSWYETAPMGITDQPYFLNGVLRGETGLGARELLERVQDIERAQGRVRAVKGGPRTIDIDILFYGERVIREPGLVVPHPRAHKRLFVLRPLAELDPHLVHPLIGKTIDQLNEELQARR